MSEGSPRILLVRLSAIGDCLHAVPVLAALRRKHPQAHLGWALEDAAHALLKGHPMVDRFHVFPRRAFKRKEGRFLDRIKALSAFRRDLRETKYDFALDVQGLTKSGLVAWWSRAPVRIGFRGEDSRELNALFLNRRVRVPDSAVHVVERNLALLKGLGIEPPERPEWAMPAYEPEGREADAFLEGIGAKRGENGRPLAIVNPGATWLTKRWPPERFGEVARGLAERRGAKVVVTWAGEEERVAAETIVRVAGRTEVVPAPPTNLRQLAALLARADLFVGNDTGPLHLAVALGVKTVAVFGASDPLRNGPFGSDHAIESGGPECQPCWKKTCARVDLACLMWVQAPQVLASCERVLDRRGRAAAC